MTWVLNSRGKIALQKYFCLCRSGSKCLGLKALSITKRHIFCQKIRSLALFDYWVQALGFELAGPMLKVEPSNPSAMLSFAGLCNTCQSRFWQKSDARTCGHFYFFLTESSKRKTSYSNLSFWANFLCLAYKVLSLFLYTKWQKSNGGLFTATKIPKALNCKKGQPFQFVETPLLVYIEVEKVKC